MPESGERLVYQAEFGVAAPNVDQALGGVDIGPARRASMAASPDAKHRHPLKRTAETTDMTRWMERAVGDGEMHRGWSARPVARSPSKTCPAARLPLQWRMAKYIQEMTSRSQAKRELKSVQLLGERLATLADSELKRLDLPQSLHDAIRQARSISTRSKAYQRQTKYISKLLRELDLEPIRAMLGELDAAQSSENLALHQLEAWRDALLDGDEDTLTEVSDRFGLEQEPLRELANAARAEKETGKPPKFSRQLYRVLRRYLQAEMDAEAEEAEANQHRW